MRSEVTKPNFFIVGAAKCGTTSIVDGLNSHSEVYFPERKEPMFFIPDIGVTDLETYMGLYRGIHTNILGDASTGYLYDKNTAELIYEFNDNAKILIVLRHPVRGMYSMWQYMTTFGNENLSFVHAIKDMENRKGEEFKRKCVGWYANYLYAERYKYNEQVKRYLMRFPANNVRVIIFEELIANPEQELDETLRFIGRQRVPISLPNSNESGDPRSFLLKQLMDKRGSLLGKLIPTRYRTSMRIALSKFNTSKSKRYITDNEFKFAAKELDLNAEISQLEKCLGRTIDIWKTI